jgi:RpiB/LacA/LacB family sugar-phosphate isomerase
VRIAIASDEAGRETKHRVVTSLVTAGYDISEVEGRPLGGSAFEYAEQVALAVLRHDADRGIVLTSRGVGSSVAANRVPGVRAAVCNDAHSAYVGAKEEGMNVLVLSVPLLQERQIDEIVAGYLAATLAAVEATGGLPPRRLQRVLSHIRENIAQELSVGELAEVAGMSQYYFSKLFKISTGTTPHQYVMRQRVERSQELLRENKLGLSEIATMVGFETQSHFTSVFHRVANLTPKHYRDMHRTNPPLEVLPEETAKAATAA